MNDVNENSEMKDDDDDDENRCYARVPMNFLRERLLEKVTGIKKK